MDVDGGDDDLPKYLTPSEFKAQYDPNFSIGAIATIVVSQQVDPRAVATPIVHLQCLQSVSGKGDVGHVVCSDGTHSIRVRLPGGVKASEAPPVASVVAVHNLRYDAGADSWLATAIETFHSSLDYDLPLAGVGDIKEYKPSAKRTQSAVAASNPPQKRVATATTSVATTAALGVPSPLLLNGDDDDDVGLSAQPTTKAPTKGVFDIFNRYRASLRGQSKDAAASSSSAAAAAAASSSSSSATPARPDNSELTAKKLLGTKFDCHLQSLVHKQLTELNTNVEGGSFYIGPVIVESVTPPRSDRAPVNVLVHDVDQNAITFCMWQPYVNVCALLVRDEPYFVAGGAVRDNKWSKNGELPFQILYDSESSKNMAQRLVVYPIANDAARRLVMPLLKPVGADVITLRQLRAIETDSSRSGTTRNLAVACLLVGVSEIKFTQKGNKPFRGVSLSDGAVDAKPLSLNVWSSNDVLSTTLRARFGNDARTLEGDALPVIIRTLIINHDKPQYRIELSGDATFDFVGIESMPPGSILSLPTTAPTVTLAEALTMPSDSRITLYAVVPYCSDKRFQRNDQTGKQSAFYRVSLFDNSRDPRSTASHSCCSVTTKAWENSAIVRHIQTASNGAYIEHKAALDSDAAKLMPGTFEARRPEDALVVCLCNYRVFIPPDRNNNDSYESSASSAAKKTTGARPPTRVITRDAQSADRLFFGDNISDERALQLHKWYVAEGHRYYTPDVPPEKDIGEYRIMAAADRDAFASRMDQDEQAVFGSNSSAYRPREQSAAERAAAAEAEATAAIDLAKRQQKNSDMAKYLVRKK